MNIPNVTGLVKVGKTFLMAYRPEILFGTSVVGTVASTVLAARGGWNARGLVVEEELKRAAAAEMQTEPVFPPKLTNKEIAQLTWSCYIPAGTAMVGAVGSTAGLHLVHVKDKKALATAALAAVEEVKSESKAYTDDVLKTVKENSTEKQNEKIEDALDEKGLGKPPWSDGEVMEKYLVRCPITGRDIWTTRAAIEEAIVDVGNAINGGGNDDLNHFWELAGWGRLEIGDELGWSGVLPSISWVNDYNKQPITGIRDDGRPYRSFEFQPGPTKGYQSS